MKKAALALAAVLLCSQATAQGPDSPVSVSIDVRVEKTVFEPGVFAAYAEKYLGITAQTEESVTSKVVSLKAKQFLNEAVKISEPVSSGRKPADMLPSPAAASAKAMEARAREAAEEIKTIRRNRMDIVTGNTDANYTGEALGKAVEYLSEREEQLTLQFTGRTLKYSQSATFVVEPDSVNLKYIAFRLDQQTGLHDACEFVGDPWFLVIEPDAEPEEEVKAVQAVEEQEQEQEESASKNKSRKKSREPEQPVTREVREFVPARCTVYVSDGRQNRLHFRLTIPQLGKEKITIIPIN